MGRYTFKPIDRNHPIFSSDDYLKDALLFNYIEGARRFDDNNLYSDGENAVICWKHNHQNVWIWNSSDTFDDVDLLISIAEKIVTFNIQQPEIFIRSEVSDKFSDIFALATKQLDYQPNDTFSLGAYLHKTEKDLYKDFDIQKMDPDEQHSIVEKFYTGLKNEFRWNDEKAKHFIDEYSIMEGYMLKDGDTPVSIAIVDTGEGKASDIRSLATLEPYRNKGYASALVSYLTKNIDDDVMVYSNKGNKAASKVWSKSGFISIGEITLLLNN